MIQSLGLFFFAGRLKAIHFRACLGGLRRISQVEAQLFSAHPPKQAALPFRSTTINVDAALRRRQIIDADPCDHKQDERDGERPEHNALGGVAQTEVD